VLNSNVLKTWRVLALCIAAQASFVAAPVCAADDPARNLGPYNASFLAGGTGISRPLKADAPLLNPGAPWSMTGWLRPAFQQPGVVVLASIGDPAQACRCLQLRDGRPEFSSGGADPVTSRRVVAADSWHAVAATYDGKTVHLFLDGEEVASRTLATNTTAPVLQLAPAMPPNGHFGGSLAQFQVQDTALSASGIRALSSARPDFNLIVFEQVGAGWPFQEHAWRGLQVPQDPWTLPRAKTPPGRPVALPVKPTSNIALRPATAGVWTIGAWRLAEASHVPQDGSKLSTPGYQDESWYPAVVPGTVLTTLIERGVYPDPYYGLNNLAIPEALSRQDYWYRSSFEAPALKGKKLWLLFKGINYRAEVWLNAVRLGEIRGAFIRGLFDVTDILHAGGRNSLAVRISPPPHPGIAHEESIAAGPGENGGALALDGPTFIASEGWDWIPGIRDRNTGIWQDVELRATGGLVLLDPQVKTRLPLPRTDEADVSITIPVRNQQPTAVPATIEARFEGVSVRKSLSLQPGVSQLTLGSADFPQLHLRHPRLWWPNGYGEPNLYTLTIDVSEAASLGEAGAGTPSDTKTLRFGIRQLTYELSLFDHEGRLRRVEVDPTEGDVRSERLVDVRHEAIKKTPGGWAASLTPAGESSPAVRSVATESLAPYLVIRVNGVPIAARGGSWGTDDARKRIDRERLEPYFRLHRDAHLNIIRNWLGQNTEEVFYDLADEYGLLVLNDFWESTQGFQLEAQDPQLFLANARDVILRYRNHPSIAVWFGRNEGVPQPIINEGLADLTATLDGTRYYTGSSNSVNLQVSGPYNYRAPEEYFTHLAEGFSVEVGSPSLSTLESLQAMLPPAERWPISDTLAYHDWHFGGNGDVATFMNTLARQFGEPSSLEDFERKAQMMNYVTYRALFEGFLAHLWTRNSARLLWMTHPSWPSNMWQIYDSDYDTTAAYYGVKSACEPVHAQMNLPDFALAVVNTTLQRRENLRLSTRVLSLDNRVLAQRSEPVNAAANAVTTLAPLGLSQILQREGLVLVVLTLEDSTGARLSQNVYWQARDDASHKGLNDLPAQPIQISARAASEGEASSVTADLENRGERAALQIKLTALDEQGNRTLPVYYSDNYITLLPGQRQRIQIICPKGGAGCAKIAVRGWNVQPATQTIGAP